MAALLLDTSVLIDVLNGKRGRPALLRQLVSDGSVIGCSPINIAEVYAGMRSAESAATDRLLSSLELFPVSRPVAKLAGDLKRDYAARGVTLNLADAIIAATALYNDIPLLTDNVKDFPMAGLTLLPLP